MSNYLHSAYNDMKIPIRNQRVILPIVGIGRSLFL